MTSALGGKRIVNTRAAHQAQAFDSLLRARGAVPLDYPCIAIMPPTDTSQLDAALSGLSAGHFEWLVLTSVNTIIAMAERLKALGLTLPSTAFRTAAIGPATADTARAMLGLESVGLPPEYVAESLVNHLPVEAGARVLLPESAIARPTLATMLAERGAVVSVVDAYETGCGQGGADVVQALKQNQIDALTFTSSSTVTNFLERLNREGGSPQGAFGLCAACIGPKTAATARESGFTRITVSSEHTLEGLVETLDQYFAEQRTASEKT